MHELQVTQDILKIVLDYGLCALHFNETHSAGADCLHLFQVAGAAGARVLADKDALSMIFSNLVENAVKYARDDGDVLLRIAREGIYVTVSEKDNSIGMSPEDRAEVFDEFYRGPKRADR